MAAVSDQTALSVSEASLRMAALRRARDQLLRQIKSKKKELERATTRTAEAFRRIHERVGPLAARSRGIEEEVHARFAELLAPGRVSKRRRSHILLVYRGLQEDGLLDYRELDFEPPAEDLPYDDEDGGVDPFSGAPPRGGYSAPQPAAAAGGQSSLRALFKRLAVALHPDLAQHDDEKARRTQVMKEVTSAYERGDLARLLELEKLWHASGNVEAAARESELTAALERMVRELKAQLREVLAELRNLRRSDEFQAAKEFKRASDLGVDPLTEIVQAGEARLRLLEEVRDLVGGFAAGKVSWAEFEAGPRSLQDEDDFDDEEQEFLELLLELRSNPPPGSRVRRRKRP